MAFPTGPFRQAAPPRLLVIALRCGVIALALLLAACETEPSGDPVQAESADAVHQRWVEAVRAGDTPAAEALADPALPDPATFAQDAVASMQDYLTSAASPTGPLQQVEVRAVTGDEGLSVWRFAAKRWCYRATLTSRDRRWFVRRWGQTSECS